MKTLFYPSRLLPFVAGAILCGALAIPAWAKPVPDNLGNGLNKLVESNLILQGKIASPPADNQANPTGQTLVAGKIVTTYGGYATRQAANYAAHAIIDPVSKNFMVDIHLSGGVAFADVQNALTSKFASLKITAVDSNYHGAGVIEGYIATDDLVALSQMDGVRSVQLALKPNHGRAVTKTGAPGTLAALTALGSVGTAFDQGVTQHRVDKINQLYNPSAPVNWDGSGMTIGCISDSFNTSGTGSAATDVGTHDLPGPGNGINSQPVVVLQDNPGGTDEGRAMCQIAYKMAPRARIGFATAFTGEVGFANNIRALAGLPGFTYPAAIQQGFKADTICDDVGYGGEPFFQTGIIGEGINDVRAAGVSYFSSAGNDIGINGYDSDLRFVPNGSGLTMVTNAALKNTNINLANVPTNLYAGGFHNFDPNGDPNKQDVAQTVNVPSAAVLAQFVQTTFPLVMEWDDPYDTTIPTLTQPPIWSSSGSVDGTTTTSVTFNASSSPPLPPFTAGQEYVITEHATSGNFDAVIDIIDPSGNTVLHQDTGVDETVYFFPQVTGQYQIKVSAFSSGPGMSTSGSFSIVVNTANGQQEVTTDLNLLVFDMAGNYVASKSLTANNLATNQPVEIGTLMGDNSTQLQFVIARANTPTAAHPATHVRWIMPGNGIPNLGPAEYFTYGSPTTGGHAIAAGCNGTAAYSVFRPSIPEFFSSPGPATIYFDDNNNRLTPPLIRQQPSVAAADGANTSFFSTDSSSDSDSNPNFFGTSAAGPHAAAIAALVLQAHGGPGSVTPAQMTTILHNTAFPHDLDPLTATGTAMTTNGGTVIVTIHSDNDNNGGLLSGVGLVTVPPGALPGTGTGENDPNSISISYTGAGNVTAFTFNPNGLATEGGNVTGGNNGVDATNTYFSNVFPGVAFLPSSVPFMVGTSLPNSLAATDVVATPSNMAPAPSNPGQAFWTLGLQFPTSNFTAGKSLHFTIGRGEQHSSEIQNGTTGMADNGTTIDDATGDIWGGGVLIPEGTITTNGMKFSGTISDGSTFSGSMVNQIGHGYTPIDGYGFINAEAAVNASLPAVQLTGVVSRMTHGAAGVFNVDLPLAGTGIECRSGGTKGTFTMVFTFANPLTSVSSASVSSGTGSVVSSSIGTDAHQYIVNLIGVTNAQRITVTLANLSDNAGDFSASVSTTMGVLLGDVNASARVDAADVSSVRQQTLQAITTSNFRNDINASGRIDAADVSIARQQTLTSLP
jgi:hypothetical protein